MGVFDGSWAGRPGREYRTGAFSGSATIRPVNLAKIPEALLTKFNSVEFSDIFYPIFPKGTFIWVFRLGLVAAVVGHIWAAVSLARHTLTHRGDGYRRHAERCHPAERASDRSETSWGQLAPQFRKGIT